MLTAAHCCNRGLTYVRLGETGHYEVKIEIIKKHPKFDSLKFKYDFCVLTLKEDVMNNKQIKPNVQIARLPTGYDCDNKTLAMDATGFGYFRGCKTHTMTF